MPFHPSHESYKYWVLANVMIGTFMAVLDSTIVNVGLPKIMASYGIGIDTVEWVITGYLLAFAVMLPASAWLSDKFGYKKMYFLSLMIFTIGSFLCGIASDENLLIVSRVIQGLGGGSIAPIGMAIITREFPAEKRGIALGFWAIAAAASISFGPLIGGYLVDNFSWKLMFDINVPVGIIGMLVTVIIQQEYKNRKVKRFDIIGFISSCIFFPVFIYALTEANTASNTEGWRSPEIILLLAVSAIFLAIFIVNELTASQPLIDLRLFLNYNFGVCNLIIFLFGMGMFGSTFLMPVYLQNSLGYTAIQAGAVFLPVGILQGFTSPVSGFISDRFSAKAPIIIGIFLLTISFYLNTFLSYLTEHDFIMFTLYLRGVGMGLLFTPLSTLALVDMPREKMAQASGLTNIVRQVGGSFGVALLTTILTIRTTYHNGMYSQAVNSQSEIYNTVISGIKYHSMHDAGFNLVNSNRLGQLFVYTQINKEAFIKGINDDFLIAAIITLAGIIPVLWLREKKKNKYAVRKPLPTE